MEQPNTEQPRKTKRALCVGINDYPGRANDLKGCINDVEAWSSLLFNRHKFSVKMLKNSEATTYNVIDILKKYVKGAQAGDHIVFTYSGHGSTIPDRSGDEADGRDETLYLYNGNLSDDTIRHILSELHPEAHFTFISDSCHSGTITRAFMASIGDEHMPKPRYMPPEDDEEATKAIAFDAQKRKRIFYPQKNMNEILISGCKSTEFSYDAHIDGQYHGAFSYYAIKILNKHDKITYNDFFKQLRQYLPGKFPQTPQLEGSEENKKKYMFETTN